MCRPTREKAASGGRSQKRARCELSGLCERRLPWLSSWLTYLFILFYLTPNTLFFKVNLYDNTRSKSLPDDDVQSNLLKLCKSILTQWFHFLVLLFFSLCFISYWFQVYSIGWLDNHMLYLVFPTICPILQLAPYVVVEILLSIFPVLCLRPCDYFVTTNLCFLISSPFHPAPQHPCPLITTSFLSVSLSLFQFYLFILFIRFHT